MTLSRRNGQIMKSSQERLFPALLQHRPETDPTHRHLFPLPRLRHLHLFPPLIHPLRHLWAHWPPPAGHHHRPHRYRPQANHFIPPHPLGPLLFPSFLYHPQSPFDLLYKQGEADLRSGWGSGKLPALFLPRGADSEGGVGRGFGLSGLEGV